ncbi:MAG: DUF6491 family protein [Woeseiaceae bacterium]|nr:DUF6491 family protein [Woeseiaceae bacterium]
MKRFCEALALVVLAGCGTLMNEQEIEAVRDFVVTNELQEVDEIRLYEQLHYNYVNDYFVTIPTRRGDYLAEFNTRCRALSSQEFTPEMVDRRYSTHLLRARFDTIRGCHIGKIYKISREQREELRNLGDAPGDEVFLDEDAAPARKAATEGGDDEQG